MKIFCTKNNLLLGRNIHSLHIFFNWKSNNLRFPSESIRATRGLNLMRGSRCETLAPPGGISHSPPPPPPPESQGTSGLGHWSPHSTTRKERTNSCLTNQEVEEANAKAHADESHRNHSCDEAGCMWTVLTTVGMLLNWPRPVLPEILGESQWQLSSSCIAEPRRNCLQPPFHALWGCNALPKIFCEVLSSLWLVSSCLSEFIQLIDGLTIPYLPFPSSCTCSDRTHHPTLHRHPKGTVPTQRVLHPLVKIGERSYQEAHSRHSR